MTRRIVDDPASITPEWMQATLSQGSAGAVAVRGVEVQDLGAGVGQLSRILRVTIDGGASCPASVVVKLPSADGRVFRMCRRMGLYRREDRFYRAVAATLPVSVPSILYREFDDRTHRFVLVMEDLANRCGGREAGRDQLAGASEAEAVTAVRAAARIHAAHWRSPRRRVAARRASALAGYRDIFRPAVRYALQFVYIRNVPRVRREHPGALSEEEYELVEAVGPAVADRLGSLSRGPRTFIHGDYRLDNMFFLADAADRFALVDWQASAIGSGLYDVAYFICTSLTETVRRRAESGLVDAYHAALVEAGVRDFPLDACRRLYRACVFACLVRMVIVAGSSGIENERARELARQCLRRTVAAIHDQDAWTDAACTGRGLGRVITWLARSAASGQAAR